MGDSGGYSLGFISIYDLDAFCPSPSIFTRPSADLVLVALVKIQRQSLPLLSLVRQLRRFSAYERVFYEMAAQTLRSKQAASIRARWRRWMSRIHIELADLVISNHIFIEVRDIVRANKHIQSPYDFHRWLVNNYAVATGIGIRRLMDPRKDVVSLYRLLKDIGDSSGVVTRKSHVSFYSQDTRHLGHRFFDSIAGRGQMCLPSHIPIADLKRLKLAHKRIRTLVNKKFAHLDAKNLQLKPPTVDEAHDVVSLFEKTFHKYETLLTGNSPITLLPAWQYDWKTVFVHPWIEQKKLE